MPTRIFVSIPPTRQEVTRDSYCWKFSLWQPGALNSAVECHLHTVEVAGSNPAAPTNQITAIARYRQSLAFFQIPRLLPLRLPEMASMQRVVSVDNPGILALMFALYSPMLGPMGRPDSRVRTHRVYMSFIFRAGWQCQFLESDLKTPLPRTFTFSTAAKVVELVERAGGFADLSSRQALTHGLDVGRGGVYLTLNDAQYGKLKIAHRGK
jgi:hypothetical protein